MDISQSVWAEADDSNNSPAPDGAPEGMAHSGVNNLIRTDRGAIKRWYNQTIPMVTAGSSTAYTLSYSVAPTTIADGMTHLIRFHTTNGAAATLNVNALGAKPLFAYVAGTWMAAPAGAFPTDFIARVAYDNASGNYRILGMCTSMGVKTVVAQPFIEFTGMPATANAMKIKFELVPATNAVDFGVQTYDGTPTLNTGDSDYAYATNGASSSSTGGASGSASSVSINLNRAGNTVSNNATVGIGGSIEFVNIQAARYTKATFSTTYLDSSGSVLIANVGGGWRANAGRITGARISTTGNFSGWASCEVTI